MKSECRDAVGELPRAGCLWKPDEKPQGFNEDGVLQRQFQRVLSHLGDLVDQIRRWRTTVHEVLNDLRQQSIGWQLPEALVAHGSAGRGGRFAAAFISPAEGLPLLPQPQQPPARESQPQARQSKHGQVVAETQSEVVQRSS